MLTNEIISRILGNFGLTFNEVKAFYDTSHSKNDRRLNYILDNKYVLKVNSPAAMWEERLQEIARLIDRYNTIGVYAPRLLHALDGKLSCQWELEGVPHTCFVEEFAKYPLYEWDAEHDRAEVVEHLGRLAAKYTGFDLSGVRSMWSIIDLAPLDVDIDEKQENCNALVKALDENGYPQLAKQVDSFNDHLREVIKADFAQMPRCVFQGDLNNSNELHQDGHFVGLIDFNLSGTDVNINVFLNETNWFPDTAAFDDMTIPEILRKMDTAQATTMSAILRHYSLNETEKRQFPYYKRIVDLFQYPDVCLMAQWLGDDVRREKAAELIRALVEKPLEEERIYAYNGN